ncbi:MAG: PHP domain-containing protein [Planctomycetota bacterium]|jgi:predicted metal-dependent phosphoesterase TrpH
MKFPPPSQADGPHAQDLHGCIDLHMHTTFSDGEKPPEYLVDWARELGLSAISITDHDNCNSIDRALAAGKSNGVEVIPGVEISVNLSGGTFHLLGYFVDHTDESFRRRLRETVESRNTRNDKILAALAEIGMDVSLTELQELAGEAVIGRPHIAALLLQKGFVASRQEAFDRYIAEGKPCYFEKEDFTPEDAIALIRQAGGVPVLAHPVWANRGGIAETEAWLKPLLEAGLMGLECHYPDHDAEWTSSLIDFCKSHNLVVTGGSDYHGGNVRPDTTLGHGRGGGFRVEAELLIGLRHARDKVRSEA